MAWPGWRHPLHASRKYRPGDGHQRPHSRGRLCGPSLTVDAQGETEFELIGASPFPRHWVHGTDGELAAKSGLIDFADWTRDHDHDRTPWHDFQRKVLMSEVESQIERQLSRSVMSSSPDLVSIDEGAALITQGRPYGTIYLILDGMLRVSVSDEEVAELGPGAIVGERAVVEGGVATATVTAMMPVRAAAIDATGLVRDELEKVAAGHSR